MTAYPTFKQAVADGIDARAQAERYAGLGKHCDEACDKLGIAASIDCRVTCLEFTDLELWYYKHADDLNEAMGPNRAHELPPGTKAVDDAYMKTYREHGYGQSSSDKVQAALDRALRSQRNNGWDARQAARIQALIDILKGNPGRPHAVPPDPAGNHGPFVPEEPDLG